MPHPTPIVFLHPSDPVRDGLTDSLDAEVEDLGDCLVPHLDQPVRAYRVTEVDPSRQHTLFERFISAERNEPPDIDVDFEHQRREEVIQYIYGKYGRHRAALTAVVVPEEAILPVGADSFEAEVLPALRARMAGLRLSA